MKLFKFKPLNNIDYVLEMICERRFYCAAINELNDPMEGVFYYYDIPGFSSDREVTDFTSAKQELRVCSFSAAGMDSTMWAHYSYGMTGVCIVIDVASCCGDFKDVEYVESPPDNISRGNLPDEVLQKKLAIWSYEKEYRIIQNHTYYDCPVGISKLIVGEYASNTHKSVLRAVCEGRSITIEEAFIEIGEDQVPGIELRPINL